MSGELWQLIGYIIGAVVAANVIWLLSEDADIDLRLVLTVILAVLWPGLFALAVIGGVAWAATLPARLWMRRKPPEPRP